jgi:glutaredoxin 3
MVIEIYTGKYCPYCWRALALLEKKQVPFQQIAIDGQPEKRQEMIARSGRFTVPQIFIGERHIGGCDDLLLLEQQGLLDALLAPFLSSS